MKMNKKEKEYCKLMEKNAHKSVKMNFVQHLMVNFNAIKPPMVNLNGIKPSDVKFEQLPIQTI